MSPTPTRPPGTRSAGADPGPRASPGRPLPSGWGLLDAVLGGGWPAGELSELVGHGRCSLALGAVRAVQRGGQPVAWVDGPGHFCPATAGVDLVALALVRPPAVERATPKQARSPAAATLLAAEMLLRSRAFALVVLDLPGGRGTLAQWFRLARQARGAGSALLLLGDERASVAGSAAALTLQVAFAHPEAPSWAPLPAPELEVRVTRRRGAAGGAELRLPAG